MRLGTIVMFIVGAVIGYCITFYYADLLWARGSRAGFVAGFVIAPAGALICGFLSALLVRGVAIFAAATLLGYVVVLFGWFAFAAIFDIADREGGKGMSMIFIGAPAGGAMVGVIAAALLSRRDASPSGGDYGVPPG